MANKFVIRNDSAISARSKTNILIADLFRIMKTISRNCPDEERKKKIQEFIKRMQFSGYPKKERAYVYTKAKRKYDECLRKHDADEQPFYRGKSWNFKERKEEKRVKRKTWYQNNGSEATFFVDATPNEELAETCRKAFKRGGLKVKVIEKTGRTIRNALVRSNPFKESNCHQDSCKVCSLDSNVHCKEREVLYKLSCQGTNKDNVPCSKIDYEGETSRSIGERFSEHDYKYNHHDNKVRKQSVFYEHVMKEHNGVNQPIKLEVTARFPGDAALRQAAEAVKIREDQPILNGKEEWTNQPRKRKVRTNDS